MRWKEEWSEVGAGGGEVERRSVSSGMRWGVGLRWEGGVRWGRGGVRWEGGVE